MNRPASDALSRRFRIEGLIGTGGMGVVVAAHHLALDKQVAIKLMRPELHARTDLVRRFVREARAAARLTSRHATQVFDVGTLDDGVPYIVMEHLHGVDLATWRQQQPSVPASLAATLVAQVCDAVAEAHAAGIVHRDLKPSNLFVTRDRDGQLLVKVLDLGICKMAQPDDGRDTATAAVLGTPMYMAPEQLRAARRADARSDVWSLGAILYELITGRVPFSGQTRAERSHGFAHVPPIARPDVPEGFEAIIARCLADNPQKRFRDASELATALAQFADRRSSAAPSEHAADRDAPAQRWAIAIAVAVAIASGAWIAARSTTDASPASPSGAALPASPPAKPEISSQPAPAAQSGSAQRAPSATSAPAPPAAPSAPVRRTQPPSSLPRRTQPPSLPPRASTAAPIIPPKQSQPQLPHRAPEAPGAAMSRGPQTTRQLDPLATPD